MANRDVLDQALSEAFATKTRAEWVVLCEKWSVPGGPVNNIAEALADPQVLLRDMVVEMEHPVAGTYKTVGNPIKLGEPDKFTPPPTRGQDTEDVLGGLLGYSPREIEALREALRSCRAFRTETSSDGTSGPASVAKVAATSQSNRLNDDSQFGLLDFLARSHSLS